MSKAQLVEMSRTGLVHAEAGTIAQAEEIARIPASHYYDPQRWQLEMERVFGRLPLMLAASVELPNPGDYKAMDAAGVPVLLTRDMDGAIQAYVNSCAHRGAQIMAEGCGSAKRFTCPYHAWSYNHSGELTNIYSPRDFGDLDKSEYGLVPLKSLERSGLIWVVPSSKSTIDIEAFLSGYDELLAHFGFENWYFYDSRRVEGPNWKIAFDGYLDFYHLPILHKDTFGSDFSNKALYFGWGPHQRVVSPETIGQELGDLDEDQWPTPNLLNGVWTIFPHVSIASFGEGDHRGVLVSQLFPGESPGESYTIQNYMLEKTPDEAGLEAAREQFDFLRHVVEQEDYATGLKQQTSLKTGARDHILFGRNEEGGQNFHQWLARILETDDEELNELFKNA
jgi:nitrite reductase/ring-hydroxylating ferredoxin subunit